jgi:hypothetical protein
MFTNEQPPEVAEILSSISEVLVAHLDVDGLTCDEYTVPVEHSG